jgi:hypothetical protein
VQHTCVQVYVGSDDMMRFECPTVMGDTDLYMPRSIQHSWNVNDVGMDSTFHPRTFWKSHVSERKNFESQDDVGFDPRDAYRHRDYFEDVKTRTEHGAHRFRPGTVNAGALLHVPPGRPSECGGPILHDQPPLEMRHRAATTATGSPLYGPCGAVAIV